MSLNPTKVLLLGPTKSGKTTLANFLSDAKDTIGPYRPTVGCRILEFQLESFNNKGNKDIHLWDCSGDAKYHNCLSALANEALAVLLVFDLTSDTHVNELEDLYNVWNSYLELSPARYLVVARKWGGGDGQAGQANKKRNQIKLGTLARISRVEWDIDLEGPKVQTEFTSFINSVLMDVRRKGEEMEINILKE